MGWHTKGMSKESWLGQEFTMLVAHLNNIGNLK